MIHNPEVNNDLQSRGVKFIMDTEGTQFVPWDAIKPEDVVIIPAFGTTVEIEHLLLDKGVEVQKYNTTCPFVERVWTRSEKLGADKYSVIIHGKQNHEETRATFSHSSKSAPSIIVRDMDDAKRLGEYILGNKSTEEFYQEFALRHSAEFDPTRDLMRVGVVNQTTMLATETQAIADYFRQLMIQRYGAETIKEHFADTRDTLCYASNDNQDSTYKLLETDADFALIVGGYNSSNTMHIVELCEQKFPSYFVNSEREIGSPEEITHFDIHTKKIITTQKFIPQTRPVKIVLTSGASCPDTLLDRVMLRVLEFFPGSKSIDEVVEALC
jgi:4-hydroxy-3-methylbut-2-enyl diphosphate reductase